MKILINKPVDAVQSVLRGKCIDLQDSIRKKYRLKFDELKIENKKLR